MAPSRVDRAAEVSALHGAGLSAKSTSVPIYIYIYICLTAVASYPFAIHTLCGFLLPGHKHEVQPFGLYIGLCYMLACHEMAHIGLCALLSTSVQNVQSTLRSV